MPKDAGHAASSNPISRDRQIRVFISSTFRDMHLERELLIKQVFPELRRICSERFVGFTEVDLRWGITEEQSAEGKVLPICLEEIQRCRPYFIGLLGERYGWIAENVPQEVIKREPWLKEHVGGRTSVTELEILHGVLNNPDMEEHAFFYFRDPAYAQTILAAKRADFLAEDAASAEKLKDLKNRIRQSGFPVETYPSPEALSQLVREQLLSLIDRLYPKEEVPDPLDQDALGHEAYTRSKLLAYVSRSVHTAAITAFAEGPATNQGLVITGMSGGGKSALLADWAQSWKEKHPQDFIFQHYFGATHRIPCSRWRPSSSRL
jgi:nephrocystin-3